MGNKNAYAKHPDGRLKYTMIVPLLVQPSAEFPDGRAAWYCKHNEKPELERAMETAGCAPGTPPEAGATITIRYVGDRPVPGMSPQKVKEITYLRPGGAGGNGHSATTAPNEAQPVPAQQYAPSQPPEPSYVPPRAPQYGAPSQQPYKGSYSNTYPQQQPPQDPYAIATGQQSAQAQFPPPGYQGVPQENPAPGVVQQPPAGPYGQPNADWNPTAEGAPTPGAPVPAPQQQQQFTTPEGLSPEQAERLRLLTGR